MAEQCPAGTWKDAKHGLLFRSEATARRAEGLKKAEAVTLCESEAIGHFGPTERMVSDTIIRFKVVNGLPLTAPEHRWVYTPRALRFATPFVASEEEMQLTRLDYLEALYRAVYVAVQADGVINESQLGEHCGGPTIPSIGKALMKLQKVQILPLVYDDASSGPAAEGGEG